MKWFFNLFKPATTKPDQTNLDFAGLNPLLARQLSEMEGQLGQMIQIQYELSQERESMRMEMNQLRQNILKEVNSANSTNPISNLPEADQ